MRQFYHAYKNPERRKMYERWYQIKARCINPNHPAYARYGARGIGIDESWLSFEQFLVDMGYPPFPKATIDRIDNEGPYCKENCAWKTYKDQATNRRKRDS